MFIRYYFLGIYWLCCCAIAGNAQTIRREHWGGNVGLLLNIGNKINRIGIKLNLYAHTGQAIQGNVQWCGIYALNSYGPDMKRFEQQIGLGITGAWGSLSDTDSLLALSFLSPVGNQTERPYSLSYAYLWYNDRIGTSQRSGMMSIQLRDIAIVCENDLFAGQGRDRYRTGSFGIYYTQPTYRLALLNILFTPDPKGTPKVRDNPQYPARFGYFDISQAQRYADCSHGILVLQAEYLLPYGQTAGMRVGIDSEWIRHSVQNKLIHDLPFIPKRFNRARNPHVPMLDDKGKPYLFMPEQRVKPPLFWWSLMANTPNFY